MSGVIMASKAVASIAMSMAIAIAVRETGNENCLWALFFVMAIW